MQAKTARGWRTLVGIVWVALGVIPLVTLPFGGTGGLWGRILDADAGVGLWVAPTVAVVVGAVLLVVLDRKTR